MHFSFVTVFVAAAAAFPTLMTEDLSELEQRARPMKRGANATQTISQAEGNCGAIPCLIFDAAEQYVTTTGQYAYQSPSVSDIRGPCPGLNAAANHGYLPRNGIASIEQTITGLGALYGMSPELAGFLAAYAVLFDGDLLSQTWSIGGPMPATILPTGYPPQGISYSHNKYEGDTSIGRQDAYLNNGDAHSLNVTRFAQVYAYGLDDDRYTLDKFRQDVAENQYYSIRNNPYYFAPLFSTTLVAPAAYNFVINFMSNHTAEEPSGYLNGDIFKSFFAVSGDYPNFTWNKGQERVPDNWYRRTSTRQYMAEDIFVDLGIGWAAYPDTFRFGGNTNGVNTYQGIDIATLTGGSITNENVLQDDNFACLFFQTQQQAVPDELKGLVNDIAAAMALFDKFVGPLASNFTCTPLAGYDNSVFNAYPGRNYSPTGPDNNY